MLGQFGFATPPSPPAVLGVKLVVVLGAKEGIDRTVRAAGREVRYVHGQRVTDEATMQAAVQAAGAVRMQFEARLSRVRSGHIFARHTEHQYIATITVEQLMHYSAP